MISSVACAQVQAQAQAQESCSVEHIVLISGGSRHVHRALEVRKKIHGCKERVPDPSIRTMFGAGIRFLPPHPASLTLVEISYPLLYYRSTRWTARHAAVVSPEIWLTKSMHDRFHLFGIGTWEVKAACYS